MIKETTMCCSLYDLCDCCGLRDYSKTVKACCLLYDLRDCCSFIKVINILPISEVNYMLPFNDLRDCCSALQ